MSLIDIEKCAAPISDKNPTGADLREDISANSLYYKIKDARNTARDLERQQAMGTVSVDESPRWNTVLSLCVDVLCTKSKDLEIVAWLIESALREQGFSGLHDAFEVANQLVCQYWPLLYPKFDADEVEARLMPLISLNGEDYEGTLIQPISQVKITQGNTVGPYALWQYQQAIENSKLTDKDIIQKRQDQGSVFIDDIQIAVQESTAEFYQMLQNDLLAAKVSFQQLHNSIVEQCQQDSLPTSQILNALDMFADNIRFILKDAPDSIKDKLTQSNENVGSTAENSVTMPDDEGKTITESINIEQRPINNRDDALVQLGRIADFFRKTEPQSPLPFMLERTIKLGKLAFPDLLKALVNDEKARESTYELLGVENESHEV